MTYCIINIVCINSKRTQSTFITWHLHVINRSTEWPIPRYSIFSSPSFKVRLRFQFGDGGGRGGRGGINEGGQSWYAGPETAAALISATRPVHPSGSGSHYRSMDGRSRERGKGLVQRPCPLASRGPPFYLSPSSSPFIIPSRYSLPILSLFRSLVEASLPSPSLSLAFVTCPSVFVI